MIGVSPDPQEISDRFRQALELPYPLVGDAAGTITGGYKVKWPFIGWTQRVTYVIGPDRRVRAALHDEFRPDLHAARACSALARKDSTL